MYCLYWCVFILLAFMQVYQEYVCVCVLTYSIFICGTSYLREFLFLFPQTLPAPPSLAPQSSACLPLTAVSLAPQCFPSPGCGNSFRISHFATTSQLPLHLFLPPPSGCMCVEKKSLGSQSISLYAYLAAMVKDSRTPLPFLSFVPLAVSPRFSMPPPPHLTASIVVNIFCGLAAAAVATAAAACTSFPQFE